MLLVGRVHHGVVTALNYARSLRPNHLIAVYVSSDERDHMEKEWAGFGFNVPLEIVHSRYRDLLAPVEAHLDEHDRRWADDTITIIIPEFVVGVHSLATSSTARAPWPSSWPCSTARGRW